MKSLSSIRKILLLSVYVFTLFNALPSYSNDTHTDTHTSSSKKPLVGYICIMKGNHKFDLEKGGASLVWKKVSDESLAKAMRDAKDDFISNFPDYYLYQMLCNAGAPHVSP